MRILISVLLILVLCKPAFAEFKPYQKRTLSDGAVEYSAGRDKEEAQCEQGIPQKIEPRQLVPLRKEIEHSLVDFLLHSLEEVLAAKNDIADEDPISIYKTERERSIGFILEKLKEFTVYSHYEEASKRMVVAFRDFPFNPQITVFESERLLVNLYKDGDSRYVPQRVEEIAYWFAQDREKLNLIVTEKRKKDDNRIVNTDIIAAEDDKHQLGKELFWWYRAFYFSGDPSRITLAEEILAILKEKGLSTEQVYVD